MTVKSWRRLRNDEIRTLASLKKLDPYPLYAMTYAGRTPPLWTRRPAPSPTLAAPPASPMRCTVFVAFDQTGAPVIGRNFDWDYSPALILFTRPPDGFASVSFVDTLDLGLDDAAFADPLSPDHRRPLLSTPLVPMDGMNERGVVVAMAAVPEWDLQFKPERPIATGVGLLRPVLDHASNLADALDILRYYNVDPLEAPPIHYLLADASGQSAIVELLGGDARVLGRDEPWQLIVNFNRSMATPATEAEDWRWCLASTRLRECQGMLDSTAAMRLLDDVKQEDTQWSTVYQPTRGTVRAAFGAEFSRIHQFSVLGD